MDGNFDQWVDAGCPDEKSCVAKGGEYLIKGRNLFGTAISDQMADGQVNMRMASGKFASVHFSQLEKAPATKSRKYIPTPPLKFLSYQDMIDLPEPEWLIEGLLMEKTSALMFGKSNSFKSFLAIDMACHVGLADPYGTDGETTMSHWHGQELGTGWRVLYVATEGALGVAKQRIPGWYEAHGIPEVDRNGVVLYPQEIAIDDDKAVSDLLRSCAIHRAIEADEDTWNDPKSAFNLVVIDIFGASMMGPETSDETARAWVRNINRIMREMGCAVLTVAHTGWADSTRARMHTHFWGSFDTRLIAEGDKASLTTVLKVDRHKDADSTGEWGFRLDKVTMPNGLTTLVPRLCDEVETTQKRRVSGKPAIALQALSEALIDHGRTVAGPNYPARPIVSVDQWRAMCDRHGLTDSDNPETTRKAFNRAKTTLIEKGLVRQFDNDVWKVSSDD